MFKLFPLIKKKKINLKKHGRLCNDHDYCYVEMPNEDSKILKYNHGEKSSKATAIIYADFAPLSK